MSTCSLVVSCSAAPLPSADFQKRFWLPVLLEPKAIRFPSGVQMGLSLAPSNVSRFKASPEMS